MTPQAIAAVATLVSFAQHGNRVELKLDRGSADLVWVSPTAFHFRRTLKGPLAEPKPEHTTDPVEFKVDDTPSALHLRTKSLDVAIQKSGALVSVRRADGAPVMADLSEPKQIPTGVSWERAAPAGVQFFGLGPDPSGPDLDRRGHDLQTFYPFLISSAGYGEYHTPEALYSFDFKSADRYRLEAPAVDYYFYQGATPKTILEQHKGNADYRPPPRGWPSDWAGMRDEVHWTTHLVMSGLQLPAHSLAGYRETAEEFRRRSSQLRSLVPHVLPGDLVPVSPFRRQLQSFFDMYEIEARDRGFPVWHALPFQFPTDPECARHADEFMLGDEMLVTPIYQPGNKREVYFPAGTWTSLETNREYAGRRTATIETAELPVFAHKGAIVPLDFATGIALHYFPDLGGEFFFVERDIGQYTQVHAAPAADVMRLEIESKKERDYEWVIHHVDKPVRVDFDDGDLPSTYDARLRNLTIRVHVKAGEDNVIHISW